MNGEPDYVVIRLAPGMDPHQCPPGMDGRWYDLATVRLGAESAVPAATATPTGRFEFREDGAVAEVWELKL